MSVKKGKSSGSNPSAAKMRSQQDKHYSRGGGGSRSRSKAPKYTDKVPF